MRGRGEPGRFAVRPLAGMLVIPLLLLAARPGRAAEPQRLHGHVPAAIARLQSVSRLQSTQSLDLVIGLPLRNQEALTTLLQQISDPASPSFRLYLTPEQFTARFGPTEEDYRKVIGFAESNKLKVAGTHPNRTLIEVNATVEDIEKTFHLRMHVYQHPFESRTFFAPNAEPTLELAVPVLHIGGLDDFVLPRPMNLRSQGICQCDSLCLRIRLRAERRFPGK